MAEVASPPKSQTLSLPIPTSSANGTRSSQLYGALSPVTQQGSFNYDRIIKSGQVLKRTQKTKSWKPIYMVLRPNLLSIYKDSAETKLRYQINLSELTAVARQKDPKRREKHIFGLFSPSKNYHLEAPSDQEAQQWVELIRQEARIDEEEEEFQLMSPSGHGSSFGGFARAMREQFTGRQDSRADESSSEMEHNPSSASLPRQRTRDRQSRHAGPRRPSHADYSGPEYASFSDFSDTAGIPGARMSALSLSQPDGRPSTSSMGIPTTQATGSVYGQRPGLGTRNASQMSGLGIPTDSSSKATSGGSVQADERVIHHGWIYLLKSKSGVRQWKKVWMVLRPKALALYKNEEEYTAQLVVPFHSIIDVVEIDPISKSKAACMQVIGDERNIRFCAFDEDSLARWLGAFKSLLSKRKAKANSNAGAVAVQPPS